MTMMAAMLLLLPCTRRISRFLFLSALSNYLVGLQCTAEKQQECWIDDDGTTAPKSRDCIPNQQSNHQSSMLIMSSSPRNLVHNSSLPMQQQQQQPPPQNDNKNRKLLQFTRDRLVSQNDPNCVDQPPPNEDASYCQYMALQGHCARHVNASLLHQQCPHSCSLCNNMIRQQQQQPKVRIFYGKDQDAAEPETVEHIRNMQKYMVHTVFADTAADDDDDSNNSNNNNNNNNTHYNYQKVRAECKNRHAECSYWATIGECQKNPHFMQIECAPACFSCEKLDYNVRCPFDEVQAQKDTIWTEPGDVNRFFGGLVQDETLRQRYNLTVLSGPGHNNNTDDGPWIIQLDNFLSPLECSRMMDLGHEVGYKRSKDIGKKKYDGTFESYTSSQRTSTTAWCSVDSVCDQDPVVLAITARIEKLTGIPSKNSERIQFLRYQEGQRYATHHDYGDNMIGRPAGVRILTVFLYLNDDGLRGGGTNFPETLGNLTVQPKAGRAVLWPSVLDAQPGVKDPRTVHQALPVERGVKYGANAWIHERDFRTPHLNGCG